MNNYRIGEGTCVPTHYADNIPVNVKEPEETAKDILVNTNDILRAARDYLRLIDESLFSSSKSPEQPEPCAENMFNLLNQNRNLAAEIADLSSKIRNALW